MKDDHPIGFWSYVGTWAGLMGLTGLTFGLSFAHLGSWGMPVALLIASTKALIVALIFMHLVEQRASNRIVALVGVLFVALLCGLILVDVDTRSPTDAVRSHS